MFDKMNTEYMLYGKRSYVQKQEENLKLYNKDGWADPLKTEGDWVAIVCNKG